MSTVENPVVADSPKTTDTKTPDPTSTEEALKASSKEIKGQTDEAEPVKDSPTDDKPKADAKGADKETDDGVKRKARPGADEKVEDKKEDAPEKYDLQLFEDSKLTKADVERIAGIAKEQKLTNEQAQLLLDSEDAAIERFASTQLEQYEAKKTDWRKSSESDKEIGGPEFKKNVELASRVVRKFGSETLIKDLESTGMGNYPELVRFCMKIGKAMGEDKLVNPNAQPSSSKKSVEELFYGDTYKKE